MFQNGTNLFLSEFSGAENVPQMLGDRWTLHTKSLRQRFLKPRILPSLFCESCHLLIGFRILHHNSGFPIHG